MKILFCRIALLLPLVLPWALALPQASHHNEKRQLGLIPDLVSPSTSVLLEDLIGEIIQGIDQNPEISQAFPGLRGVLQKVKDDNITSVDYICGLLRAIQHHDAYKEGFAELSAELQKKVERFMNGEQPENIVDKRSEFYLPPSPAAKHHFTRMEEAGNTASSRAWLNAKRQQSPVVYEDAARSKVMKVYVGAPFENWGLTVQNRPAYTFVPTTVQGIQNLIKFAKLNNKRVRASGYRHTWSPLYSADGEILVSMLDLAIATAVPDPTSLLPNDLHPGNELKTIELMPGSRGNKALVRIGAAVTNEELRRWAIGGNAWSLPLNTVIVEVTVGGTNAPICHGAGIKHKTLSDLVREISYVDANGNAQAVSDPTLIKAAAGSFGLLGVVTHITFEFDKMTYALMEPKKTPVGLAIPPPLDYIAKGKVPVALDRNYSAAQLEAARLNFVDRATKDYYSEWFWFAYQDEAWVNCWNNTEDGTGAYDYPTPPDVFFQWIQGWIGGIINDSLLFRALPGRWQAYIFGTMAHMSQPPIGLLNTHIKTYLPDALHFRRGTQNMRVRGLELEIPIPPLASDPTQPDFTIVQRAWWDAIMESYTDPTAPMRIAMELRIMGDSDIIMAPQRGNKFGTASIEVVSSMAAVADGSWDPYAQRIANKWMALGDENSAALNIRPHWAKEWDGLTVKGMPWKDYMRDVAYRDEIPIFKEHLERIGSTQGWNLSEAQATFSNPLLDHIFFNVTVE